jgi:hypothetical protein
MNTRLALLNLLLAPVFALAQAPLPDAPESAPVTPLTLPELAESADLVALVQVADTDYEYARDFPSGGTAFLKVLIPYKVSRPLEDILEVYEEGLREHECYFPNPTVFEEGRRYLVFLKFSEDVKEQYNGLEQGCALEALVTADNSYALRYPLQGLALSEEYAAHAQRLTFADAYAVIEEDAITPNLRNDLLAEGYLEAHEEGYRYTHGIPLSTARQLLGPDALTLDRALK